MRPTRRRSVLACAAAAALAFGTVPLLAWEHEPMAQAARRLGPAAEAALAPLQVLLRSAATLDDAARLSLVNQFYNQRIRFVADTEAWGREDYWASPLETLGRGQGDCEDYAIAKYATLLASGMKPSRLRLVYVRAQIGTQAQAHMVLAYQATVSEEPLILDNLRQDVLPARERPDLTPVFSFSTEGLWQGNGGAPAGDPLVRLSRWREVWSRTLAEGFRGYSDMPQNTDDPR
jgi:predicted transglutaminase-like cysteine proteinase